MTMPFHVKVIWKEVFEEVIFSSNIIKTLESLRDGVKKEEKKKERKKERKKLQESLQIKGKSIFWEDKNTSTSKIPFDVISFSPPSIIPFQKLFPKSLRMFS
jgi:hypothetical protein